MVNLSNIRVAYGERVIFNNGDFLLRPGDKVGLVGPNGAGKTTLFKVICGVEKPDEGTVSMDPGTVVGYFSQEVGEMSGRSALEEVLAGAGRIYELGREISVLEHRMSDADGPGLSDAEMSRYGALQMEFQRGNGYDLENRAQAILTGLGIGKDRFHLPVESFSGGWKMRIALARILLLDPDVLLMDEPTNHLDLESIVWLEEWLASYRGDLVMTSICSRTVEVAAGAAHRVPEAQGGHAGQGRGVFIARFGARASHAAQVQSRVKTIEKIERIAIPPDPKEMKVRFAPVARSGDIVVRMEDLSKAWPLPDGSFHLDASIRIPGPTAGRRPARGVRPPVSLQKLLVDEGGPDTVDYRAAYSDYFHTDTKVFPAIEFLVKLLQQLPDSRSRLVRTYGLYSSRCRPSTAAPHGPA